MQNFTTPKDAQIIYISGTVLTEATEITVLQIGESLATGTILTLAQGSEIILKFADGKEQKIANEFEELITNDVQTNESVSVTAAAQSENQAPNQASPDNTQTDIDLIQAAIESGDDIELPDTVAGGLTTNEGTYFVTLDRDGNQLLAGAGYDTAAPGTNTAVTDAPVFVDQIDNINALPDAVDDTFGLDENTQLTGALLGNDDLGDEATTVTAFDGTSVNGGTVTVDAGGNFTYTPVTDFVGSDTFTYTITDADGDTSTATVTINVANVNQLPNAVDDTFGINENTPLTGALLGNDDLGDEATTVTAFDSTSVNGGTVTVDAGGNFTYTPVTDFVGSDTFTYTITDADGDTSTATVTINVANVNQLPNAVDDTFGINENTQLTGVLLGNDDLGDEATTVTAFDSTSVNGGTVTVDAGGNFTYTPVTDFVGSDTFSYTITDADGDTSTATVTINVANVNQLPNAVDDTFGINENTQLTGALLGNDDLGDEATTVTAFDSTSVNGGTVTVDAGGNFTYTPVTDFVGSDTFTYTITDADGDTSTATVTINVANVNQLPNAVDDTFGINENTQLTGALLGNDDLGDEATTVTAFDSTSVNGGTVTVDAGGNFTYTPVTDFVGSDTFTYTITDADGDTSTATVTINVANVNQLPNAVDDTFGINENTPLTGALLGNDDLGDEATTVTAFDGTSVNGGTVTVDAGGNFTYTPVTDFVGSDTFTYTITDADGDTSTATVTINVANVNQLPNAVDDTFGINENTQLTGALLGNDDLGDEATTVTAFDSTSVNGGTVTVDAGGNFTYTPVTDFVGSDTFTYTITDADGDTSTATVTINVANVNQLPNAVDDTFGINENTQLTGALLGNDDLGDEATTVTAFDSTSVNGGTVTVDAGGNFTYTPVTDFVGSDTFTYTITDADGDTSTATVTINVANVNNNPPVAADDNFSVAEGETVNGNIITHDDGDGVIDTDGGDGATLTVTQVNGVDLVFDGAGNASVAIKDGTLLIKADGSFTYNHNGNDLVGAAPSFTYTLSDGTGVDTGNVTIAVTPVNDPPVAADDNFSVAEGATVNGNIITHDDGDGVVDTDGGDGSTLTVTQVNGADLVFDGVTGVATVAIKDGTLLIKSDGSFTYNHNGNDLVGAAPSFTYTLSDGTGVDTGNVTIAVTPENDPPVAADDNFSVAEGDVVNGNIITHDDGDGVIDTDGGDGATLTVTQVNGVDLVFDGAGNASVAIKDGTLLIKADGSFTYNHNGNDLVGAAPSFTYTLSDGTDVDTGNVTIAVTPENDPPIAADDNFSVAEGATVNGNIITHDDGDGVIDTDGGDGATLTVTQVNGVDLVFDGAGNASVAIKDGTLLIKADGSFTYNHNGNDLVGAAPSFTYTLSDGTDVDTGNVTIAVTPVNDPPVAADDNFSVAEGDVVSGNIITHDDGDGVVDTDGGDGATLTVTQVNGVDLVFDGAGNASVAIKDGTLLIKSDGSFTYSHNGNDLAGAPPSFAYTLSDGTDVDTGNVTIAVTPVNDPPIAADDNFSVAEGDVVNGNIITHDDGDGVIDTDGGDGSTLTVTQVNGADLVFDGVTGVATVAIKDGTLLIKADGSFTYNHNGNDLVGAAPSFTYTLSDGTGVDTGNVTIAVTPENDPPVAADDNFSVAEGDVVNGNIITHDDGDGVIDTDGGDGATLTVTQVNGVDLVFDGAGNASVAIKDGTLLIKADGSFTYNHNGNDLVGAAPSFTYTLSDGTDVDTGNVTITVTPENDPPVAADDNFSVAEGATVNGNIITHDDGDGVVDTDGGDGSTLTVTQVNGADLVFDGVTGVATVAIKDGTLLIKSDGSFTYNHNGNDLVGAAPSFTYTLSDGTDVDTGNVTIAVTPVNDPPVAADDNFSVAEGNVVSGNIITHDDGDGVIDTDGGDGSTLTVTQVNGANLVFDGVTGVATVAIKDGTLLIKADGSFTYNHNGNDLVGAAPSFTYTLSDGTDVDTGNVTIAVTPENDPPVAADDSFSVAEGATVNGNIITHDDGDGVIDTDGGDGSTLTVTQVNGADLVFDGAGIASVAIKDGTLLIKADGSFTYNHNGNDLVGAAPSFTYTLSDGIDVDTGNVTIAVTPVNDPPVAADDSFSVAEGATVNGNIITHDDGDGVVDTDGGDGSTLTVTQVNGADLVFDGVTGVASVAIKDGTLLIKADGSFTYNHNGNDLVGAAPSFTYTLSDGTDVDTGNVTIAVTPVNDPPVAADDNFSVAEGNVVSGNIITHDDGDGVVDTDGGDGSTLTVTQVNGADLVFDGVTGVATVAIKDGTLLIKADGSFTYNHNGNDLVGAAPSFTYTLSDGTDVDTGNVTIAVTPENDPPVAADDNFSVAEGDVVNGNIITHDDGDGVIDTDGGDGATLTVTQVNGVDLVFDGVTGVASVAIKDGTLLIKADGSFTYNHNGNDLVGAAPSFTYTLSDGTDVDTGNVTIAVTPVNDPPVAADDNFSVAEGNVVSGNIITHDDGDGVVDTDGGDGSTLTVTQVNGADLVFDGVTGVATVAIKDGTLLIKADGSFTYNHNGNDLVGAAPSFTYTLSDGTGVDTGNVTIAVTPVNDPPVAADDSFSVAEGDVVSGNIITHDDGDGVIDTDGGDGATLTVTQVNGVDLVFDGAGNASVAIKDGTLLIKADGSFTYNHNGNDLVGAAPSFTYTLSDGTDVDTGNVTIAVTPENDPPVAADDNFSVAEGATVSGNIITHDDGDGVVDTDGGDGATLTVTQVNGVDLVYDGAGNASVAIKDGTLLIKADGSFTYNHNGNDLVGAAPSFTYTLSDGTDVDTGNVTIAVTPVNDPPIAADDNFSVAEGDTVNGNIITHDDGDGVVDTDGGDGATLTVTQVNGVDLVFDGVTGVATVAIKDGTLLIKADGSFTYNHNGNDLVGAAPSFTYTLSDGTDVDSGNVTIEVTPTNNIPPVAADDSFSVAEGETVSGNIVTHDDGDGVIDTDGGDGATLTVTQVNGVDLVFDGVTGFATVAIKDGTLLIKSDGSFTYNNDGFVLGSAPPSFTYTLSDGTDVDTGAVTISVLDSAPVAADDINYIKLTEFGKTDTANRNGVKGNVISRGSSGDNQDTSDDGFASPAVTQVVFDGDSYLFSDSSSSHSIDTGFGTLTLFGSGAYYFITPKGMPMPSSEINLTFSYTIQDGDLINPEEDSANLTINIKPPSNGNKSLDLDIDFNQASTTIDTTFEASEPLLAGKQAFTNFTELEDLGDILTDSNTNGLETYLAAMSEDESSIVNIDLTAMLKEPLVAAAALEKGQNDLEQSSFTTVTNGLLEGGGTLISDQAVGTSTPIAEFDSAELL